MKPLKNAVRLDLSRDIPEDVDHREAVREGGGDHDVADVDPDSLTRFRMRQYIATLNCPSLPRRREEGTVGTALEPPRPIPAGEHLIAGSPEDLRGLEPEQPLGRCVPEDEPLGLVDGENAIGRVRQALCKEVEASALHVCLSLGLLYPVQPRRGALRRSDRQEQCPEGQGRKPEAYRLCEAKQFM